MEEAITTEADSNTIRARVAWFVCLCMALFHMYTAGIGLLQQPVQRAVHVCFTLVIIYLLYPVKRRGFVWLDGLLLMGSLVGTGYVALFYDDIAMRGSVLADHEFVLGIITIVVVMEAGRRVLGLALPILSSVFLLYCYFGNYAPGFLQIRGYSLTRIIQHMYLTNEGIFGVAIGVSSTYIFMFILFGAFLLASGGATLFNNLAMALAGGFSGGPAKVAVLCSGLMGTINGSSIANTATVGALTIPMMKKVGYSSEESAAIEACASTGGQLMPPIMGAGAFIMAEFLNIPYLTIAVAAILPSVLYYTAVFVHVHFVARKHNIQGIPSTINVLDVLKSDGYLLLPLLLIIAMLMMHYTPLKAAFWAIIAIYCLSLCFSKRRMTLLQLGDTLAQGAKGAVGTAAACAVVGFIVGSFSLTALGLSFSGNILNLTANSLFPTLILSMVACLIIGMGLPTTANYIVTSTIIAPILFKMGVPGLAANLFVFYFGIKADITPPVCLATYTAAGIAGANPTMAGIKAFSIALSTFFIPFMFVYSPEILLQGNIADALFVAAFAALGICGVSGFAVGWYGRPVGLCIRGSLLFLGIGCFLPFTETRSIGAAGLILLAAFCWMKARTDARESFSTT